MRKRSIFSTVVFLLAAAFPLVAGPLKFLRGDSRLPPPVGDWNYYDDGRPDAAKVELGRLLFFDKILSGNRNISCATCHHPRTGTSDGLSLSVGEGGRGQGPERDTGDGTNAVAERVPRNAPALFNLGAMEFRRMFHDGRVELDRGHPAGFSSPAGDDLPPGLDNTLAVQAMFPVTSTHEMAGQPSENDVARAAGVAPNTRHARAWSVIEGRLRAIPGYVSRFQEAFDDVASAADIDFVHAANAIAAFEAVAFRSDGSPFDRYLRGDRSAMTRSAERGMRLFYGKAKCSTCHAGVFQTDHAFHAIAMPQIGPGKGDGPDGREDHGRGRVTEQRADRFRFRTPSLRNVALTGPWGHAGTYTRLDQVILHHLRPVKSLREYDPATAVLPSRPDLDALDGIVSNDPARVAAIAAAATLPAFEPSPREAGDLLEFLWALTDPAATNLDALVPESVPSNLPVAD